MTKPSQLHHVQKAAFCGTFLHIQFAKLQHRKNEVLKYGSRRRVGIISYFVIAAMLIVAKFDFVFDYMPGFIIGVNGELQIADAALQSVAG